jgi:putative heme-binding domain-containing protein
MYRFLIEHPRWIDPARLAKIDVRAGADKGRIYRVVPDDRPARPVPKLDRLATPDLARKLESPNGTVRDTVQRLLAHRADKSAIPVLAELAGSGKLPQTRLQALCTLEALGGLSADLIRSAVDDSHPGVRRQAIRLAEQWFGRDPTIGPKLSKLVDDADPTVRFQLALSLGAWDDPAAAKPLAALALREPVDPWILAAVLSSATPQADRILFEALDARVAPDVRMKLIVPLIATASGRHDVGRVRGAVSALTRPRAGGGFEAWQIAALSQLFETGLGPTVFADGLPAAILEHARSVVKDPDAKAEGRTAAIGLLGWTPALRAPDGTVIEESMGLNWPISGQAGLARAILRLGAPRSLEIFHDHWKQWGPGFRSVVLDAFGARPESLVVILDALADSTVATAEIDASLRERLLRHSDIKVRDRAAKVFEAHTIGDRKKVRDRYLATSSKPGDDRHGKVIFNKVCSTCHKFGGEGFEVGPDLSALTETSPEALLTAILEPSRDVDARYANYLAALSDGRVLNGLIAAETANAITLKRQGGAADVVLRADLDELKTSGQSLMPDGLENDVSPADMRDLIAYLQTRGVRPKSIAGNHPEIVHQDKDGSIRLPAAAAEIYGPSLTFETATKNLGYWHSADDRADWTFTVSRPGEYTLSMEWACADESAGNRFLYQLGRASRVCTVGATGPASWGTYRTIFLDEVSLTAGTHRIEIKPVGEVRNALMDLRAVVLTPRLATP